MNNPLTNFFNLAQTEVSAAVALFNILFAFVLSLTIVWLWRRTHKGLSYSQSFAFTITMLGPLAAMIMMIVQNNLVGAFALLGAFSLIRFRTIIKEARDVAFLFFSLAVGVACGTNNYAIAIIATLTISGIVYLLYRVNFGAGDKTGFILTFEASNGFKTPSLESLFTKYVTYQELLHAKRVSNLSEYAYALHFKNAADTSPFMEELNRIPEVSRTYLITGKELIEY